MHYLNRICPHCNKHILEIKRAEHEAFVDRHFKEGKITQDQAIQAAANHPAHIGSEMETRVHINSCQQRADNVP